MSRLIDCFWIFCLFAWGGTCWMLGYWFGQRKSAGTYAARVTVTDNLGATATASITINVSAPPMVVEVLYPNGGEVLLFDSRCTITWSVTNSIPTRQDIYLSLDGGSSWAVLASQLSGSVNSFRWRVPRTATGAARIKVRVWDGVGSSVDDVSDGDFAIRKKLR